MAKKEIEIAEEEIAGELKEDSKIKRLFAIFSGILMGLLVVSFVFVNYPIGSILGSQIESKIIINSVISLTNFSVSLENSTYEKLKDIYFKNQKTENAVCMLGYEKNRIYHIESLYQPVILSKSFSQVVFQPCSNDTLIMLHTHPYKECLASDTDLQTLNETKESDPKVLMIVMCESSRFSIYG